MAPNHKYLMGGYTLFVCSTGRNGTSVLARTYISAVQYFFHLKRTGNINTLLVYRHLLDPAVAVSATGCSRGLTLPPIPPPPPTAAREADPLHKGQRANVAATPRLDGLVLPVEHGGAGRVQQVREVAACAGQCVVQVNHGPAQGAAQVVGATQQNLH